MESKQDEDAMISQEIAESKWSGPEKGEEKGLAQDNSDESNQMSGDEVLQKVSEYFYMDDDLAKEFEGFVDARAGIVDLSSPEYKLEYTSVYSDYKDLFESRIGGYIEMRLKSTIEIFYEALEKKMREDENSSEAIFGQILVSVTDFDVFMTMLREGAVKAARNKKN